MDIRMVSARRLVGRRIVGFDPGSYQVDNGLCKITMHEPVIHLDDGTILTFTVEENPNGGEYGINIVKGSRQHPRRGR